MKQSGPYKTVLNRKFSAALQQVELLSALAQVVALSMINFLYCWIIALLETNLLARSSGGFVFEGVMNESEGGVENWVRAYFFAFHNCKTHSIKVLSNILQNKQIYF